jgi:DNA-binding GntR family transcriptional regulator
MKNASNENMEELLEPVGKSARSLPALVAERILNAIIAGKLAPGERLTEIALADEHRVSRATVREALVQLERQRFVERLPRYGARVAAISLEDVSELFEIRAALLALAAAKAAANASDAQLEQFDAMVTTIGQAAAGTAETYAAHSIAAQHQVIAMSRSRWVNDLYMQLANLTLWRAVVRQRSVSFTTAERRRQSASDWRRLADALRVRDTAAAEQAAKALILASSAAVQAQLRVAQQDPG